MNDTYSNCREAFGIYSERKKLKIKHNKIDNAKLTKRELRLMRNAFNAGWEYRHFLKRRRRSSDMI